MEPKSPEDYTDKEIDVLAAASPERIRKYRRSAEYWNDVNNIQSVRHEDGEQLASGYTSEARRVLELVLFGAYKPSSISWGTWIYNKKRIDCTVEPSQATKGKLIQAIDAALTRFPELQRS